MALFALYRIFPSDGQLRLFLSDIRPHRHSIQYHRILGHQPWLIPELTEELGVRGFIKDFERRTEEGPEIRYFTIHRIPTSEASPADAIHAVCARHGIVPRIVTHHGRCPSQVIPSHVKTL